MLEAICEQLLSNFLDELDMGTQQDITTKYGMDTRKVIYKYNYLHI